ncbi:serine/threonine-protein kinase D6PK-like [Cynara cardunculus var. scolymus]|uniref:non-specific serine/threonine protein kinase n=1 Tax=Cynara cardunculus var. scolymus TaxID=59895 RepID=A0A103XZT7_CYNCS|nr:serine/threonine-protein kinase D6PK-like [Cynara cardunculus var. scolymus]XP_024983577.1 serine/threonine-protein kinase D6PK-like [Cynara cardunculus var. scolymus]KVH99904.1 hypothetical protein Ccrd_021858 [Cynara cardunculus var. scolymus]
MGSFYGTHEIVELRDEPKLSDYSKPYLQARVNDKEKRPQGCSRYLEDDINKLFEAINVRSSFNGSSFSDETGGATPRKNPSKKPMRMSTSSTSGIGYSEPVSLKQALRGLCISQASEMAAIKRLSMPPGSPALSDSGKLANLYKSVVKASESGSSVAEDKVVEVGTSFMTEDSTSNSSGRIPWYLREPKVKPYSNSAQSSPKLNIEKSAKHVGPAVKLNEILQEPQSESQFMVNESVQEKTIISIPSPPSRIAADGSLKAVDSEINLVNDCEQDNLMPGKPTLKSRHKGKSQSVTSSSGSTKNSKLGKSTRTIPRAVKTVVIQNKNLVKKKSKQDFASANVSSNASIAVNAKLAPDTSKLICQRCHCAIKDATEESNKDSESPLSTSGTTAEGGSNNRNSVMPKEGSIPTSYGKTVSFLNNNKNSKFGDKGEFTQSSNSSICEYSSSTSISEERNLSGCSIGNRPHMSKDIKWQAIHHMMKQDGFLGLRHFNLLKKLGCGDIGTVYLAELIGTNCPFAIKIMDNEFLERRQKMPRAHMEREILSILDHPFLPTLYAHFVSENLSCLVMEYCPGGDLHVLRQKQPARFFHEQAARFYVAEVLLALEYLHMLGIVYRDLKPENILVREDGHIMVTDFDLSLRCSVNPTLLQSPSSGTLEPPRVSGPCAGSSCIDPFCIKPTCQVSCFRPRMLPAPKGRKTKLDPAAFQRSLPQLVAEPTEARSNSFVGTHEYLAPEIIKGDGHGSAVDWWTFGIFLYELLYGKTPFKGSVNDQTLANVVLENLRFPETPLVSFQARDLIKGLLVKEPENRLGSQRGAAEIKQHPFFDGLNWALIRCASPPELPEPYDVSASKAAALEKAKKYLDYDGSSGGHLEFELF